MARATQILDGESLCMGFAGGHASRLLVDLAQTEGLSSFWTWIDSETRTYTILVSSNGTATEVDEPGLPVTKSDWQRLREDVRRSISSASLICLSGSLPPQSSADELQGLFSMLVDSGKHVWVDTSGAALNTALDYSDLCVKVNGDEIGVSLGFKVNDVPLSLNDVHSSSV